MIKSPITNAIILAAGKGSRLGNISDEIPKPMIEINNKPVLEHNIILCKSFGVKNILINTHHLGQLIEQYFGDGKKFGVNIYYNREKKIMGTAGALLGFRNMLGNMPFIVIYGDNYPQINLEKLYQFHTQKNSKFTIHTYLKKDCSESGRVEYNENDILTNFYEKDKNSKNLSGYVNSGIYIIDNYQMLSNFIKKGTDFAFNVIPEVLKFTNIYIYKSDEKVYPIDNLDLLKKTKLKFNKIKV
jgi:NDP-sugar pyrophosphorylase family protein